MCTLLTLYNRYILSDISSLSVTGTKTIRFTLHFSCPPSANVPQNSCLLAIRTAFRLELALEYSFRYSVFKFTGCLNRNDKLYFNFLSCDLFAFTLFLFTTIHYSGNLPLPHKHPIFSLTQNFYRQISLCHFQKCHLPASVR